jgi:hypothetical protein
MGGCTENTRKNLTDSGCCCLKKGTHKREGHYVNFSWCPDPKVYAMPRSPGNVSQCRAVGPGSQAQTCTVPGRTCGSDPHSSSERGASLRSLLRSILTEIYLCYACSGQAIEAGNAPAVWPCDSVVNVRELLGLGPAYYFGITPKQPKPSKYDGMWSALFDAEGGFWAPWGPTTVERRATCFNHSQDLEECNWVGNDSAEPAPPPPLPNSVLFGVAAFDCNPSMCDSRASLSIDDEDTLPGQAGPSWPYETSRVLSGLSNFLIEYPAEQSAGAGMTPAHYTRLLRTYARSMTHGNATNGSVP